MLPYKLTMQAFGPYLNRIEIPFYKLNTSDIYLITGVTGSGKTTIFDAICFALFNASSVSYKGNTTFKSHYADDSDISFVEFEFIFKGQKYKITRSPSYKRKKIKGDGYIQENSKAQILLPDSKLIIGAKEVDAYINELLGVNINQFSQIALLAQGEFLKLLNSDTKTRGDIFRNIFKTDDFLKFQLKLKENLLKYKQEYENTKDLIIHYIGLLDYSNSDIRDQKEYFKNNNVIVNFDEFLEKIKKENSFEDQKIKELNTSIVKNEKIILDKQKELDILKNKQSLVEQKNQLETNISNEKNILDELNADYEKIPAKQKQVDNIKLEIQKLNFDYKNSLELIEAEKYLLDQTNNMHKINIELEEYDKKLLDAKFDHLSSVYMEYLNYVKELNNKKQEFVEFQKEVAVLVDEYEKLYQNYLSNIAGILAVELKDNSPCPVCGSYDHPKIAKLDDSKVTKEYLDQLKNDVQKNKDELDLIAQNCSLIAKNADMQLNKFNVIKKHYNIDFCENKCNFSAKNCDWESRIDEHKKYIDALKLKIDDFNLSISSTKSRIETIKKDLNNINPNEILKQHADLSKLLSCCEDDIQEVIKKYDTQKLKYNTLISKLDLLNDNLVKFDDLNIGNFDEIVSELNNIQLNNETYKSDYQNMLLKYNSNNKMLDQIIDKYKEFCSIEKMYASYKNLSDCANGTLKGKPRIAFEQYIQGYYLDLVLHYANITFSSMTNNQYMLLRKKDTASYQSQSGLDIEVMDFHTFKKRDTKTLSGGESFKAALSMALGLSRCVGELSNSVEINAMFIDEGFGTLDNESIELALDVVIDLCNSNRLVGVISHIDDLKSKIQNQIIAIKTDKGSDIKLTF